MLDTYAALDPRAPPQWHTPPAPTDRAERLGTGPSSSASAGLRLGPSPLATPGPRETGSKRPNAARREGEPPGSADETSWWDADGPGRQKKAIRLGDQSPAAAAEMRETDELYSDLRG